ncbi:MAG: response regulator [Alphaproteobacteria bacterium]|nr:response regulator [Alphaproteobacteria bacterium]
MFDDTESSGTVYAAGGDKPSLVAVLARVMLFGLFLVFALMAAFLNVYGGNTLRSMTDQRVDYILRTQSDNIAQILWDFETEKVETALKNIVEDPNIFAAQVLEMNDGVEKVFAQVGWENTDQNTDILNQPIVYSSGGSEGRAIGVLQIALDYSTVQKQIVGILWSSALFFALSFAVLTVFSYNIIKRAIQPVSELSASLVDADYFTHTIEKRDSPAREVSELFDTLIKMQRIMQEQTREIHSQKVILDTIVENLPLGMTAEDPKDGAPLVINSMYRRLFGIQGGLLDGRSLSRIHAPEDGVFLSKLNDEVVLKKAVVERRGYKARRAGGGFFIAHVVKAPVLDQDGNVTMIISMVADETEQHNAHKEVLAAKNAAEKANMAKSQFLANMSHELRTPMNSIMGLTHMMIEDGGQTEEHSEMLDTVRKSSQILLHIVNDILDLSKIESGGVVLESVPFDLHDSVALIVDTIRPLASAKSLTLNVINSDQDMKRIVMGDPTRFSRILTNLCGNAVKFTTKGEITVDISCSESVSDTIYFTCVVRDTGIGIPEDKIDYIFEKFSQADDTITRKYGGTGLGLAIAKQLVELMGGMISVQSIVGKGSAFTVRIPFRLARDHYNLSEQSREQSRGRRTQDRESISRKPLDRVRVLVAEDHDMNQIMIGKLLRRLGVQDYTIVQDGALALAEFMHAPDYDLIIMDCHMPNMTGYEATGAIRRVERERGEGAHVPIVAVTADAMVGTRERCLEAGMDAYVSKPVNAREFEAVLAQWFAVGEPASSRPVSRV